MDPPDVVLSLIPSLFAHEDQGVSPCDGLEWNLCADLSPEHPALDTEVAQVLKDHPPSPVSTSLDRTVLISEDSMAPDGSAVQVSYAESERPPVWPDPIAITATSADYGKDQLHFQQPRQQIQRNQHPQQEFQQQQLQQQSAEPSCSLTSLRHSLDASCSFDLQSQHCDSNLSTRIDIDKGCSSSSDWQDRAFVEEQVTLERILSQNPNMSMVSVQYYWPDLSLPDVPNCLQDSTMVAHQTPQPSCEGDASLKPFSPVSNVSSPTLCDRSFQSPRCRRPKLSSKGPRDESSDHAACDEVSSRVTAVSSQESIKSPLGKQRRRYNQPRSSKYCHLCARHQRAVEMLPCGNLQRGLCQKSVCRKCFTSYKLDWDLASKTSACLSSCPSAPLSEKEPVSDGDYTSKDEGLSLSTGSVLWLCPHCENTCPKRAKCYAYDRQTVRRRAKTQELRQREAEETK